MFACKYALEIKLFSHPRGLGIFPITPFSNCSTRNLIYVISCPFEFLYIGSSTHAIKTRVLEHVFHMHNKVHEAPLTDHFLSKVQYLNLRFFVVEKLDTTIYHTIIQKSQRETFWKFRLDAMGIYGLK